MFRFPFRFRFEPSDDILTAQARLGVVGQILSHMPVGRRLQTTKVPGAEHPGTFTSRRRGGYLGLLAQGKNDFDHMEAF